MSIARIEEVDIEDFNNQENAIAPEFLRGFSHLRLKRNISRNFSEIRGSNVRVIIAVVNNRTRETNNL